MGDFINKAVGQFRPAPPNAPAPKRSMTILAAANASTEIPAPNAPQATPNKNQIAISSHLSTDVATAIYSQPEFFQVNSSPLLDKAAQYLNAKELQSLKAIHPEFQPEILKQLENTDGLSVGQVRKKIQTGTEQAVNKIMLRAYSASEKKPTEVFKFEGRNGRDWSLETMLSLTSTLQKLPQSQRKKLSGLTLIRDSRPAAIPGMESNLLAQMASSALAGQYDIQNKSVVIYDRGLEDGFPALNQDLKQSVRTLQQKKAGATIKEAQQLLNPFLVGMGKAKIPETGSWGPETERGLRMVQIELLDRHLENNHNLKPAQRQELNSLKALAASPLFDMMNSMKDFSARIQDLNLLPDQEMRSLLQEFSKSEFGESSLRFLLQDISDDFRSNGDSVSRAEELVLHEIGHHFQLGQSNETYYISEFSKLSNWKESVRNEAADGYIGGVYQSEELLDVYNNLASNGKIDAGAYHVDHSTHDHSSHFVSAYAATDPMEDFAESYKTFILEPAKLMAASPEKFFFMNALASIQSEKRVSGNAEKTHYDLATVKSLVKHAYSVKNNVTNPPDAQIKEFTYQIFERIKDPAAEPKFLSTTASAILESHREVLDWSGQIANYVSPSSNTKAAVATARNLPQRDKSEALLTGLLSANLKAAKNSDSPAEAQAKMAQASKPQQLQVLFASESTSTKEAIKDSAYASMLIATARISGQAHYLHDLKTSENQDQQDYQAAHRFKDQAIKSPSALFSTETFTHGWSLLRETVSKAYNPEERQSSASVDFFTKLETNPQNALPDIWNQLPDHFKERLYDQRFINSLSGNQGKNTPASFQDAAKEIDGIMEMVDFERSMAAP